MIAIVRFGVNKYAVCELKKTVNEDGTTIFPIKEVLSSKPLLNRIDGKKEIAQMIIDHHCPWQTEIHIDMQAKRATESDFSMSGSKNTGHYLVCKDGAFAVS